MELSPRLYHLFVRPKWITKAYTKRLLTPLLREFDLENKQVLDFGCGIGSNCTMFHPEKYIGIDCDDRRVEYARRIYPKYQFKSTGNGNIPSFGHIFDFILVFAVMHHIPTKELSNILQVLHRTLKPGGNIIAIEPCFFKEAPFTNRVMSFFDRGKYIQDRDGYLNLFQKCNYEVKNMKKVRKALYNEIFFSASPKS